MMRLSDRMLEDLRVRNYSPETQKAYVDRVAKFVAHFGNKPPAWLVRLSVVTPENHHRAAVVLTQVVAVCRLAA